MLKLKYILISLLLISLSVNTYFIFNQKTQIKKWAKTILNHKTNNVTSNPYIEDSPFAYYLVYDSIIIITPYKTKIKSQILPNSLLICPGNYSFCDSTYSLQKEGLYRFINPLKENEQRIVYKQNVDTLLSSLSWIVSHGNSGDTGPLDTLTKRATKSKLFISCGKISEWAHSILDSIGIKSRLVSGLTLEKWNSYDNGHTLIEVFVKTYNKWVLYDLAQNVSFLKGGKPLSLIEFCETVVSGEYKVRQISSDIRFDVSNFKSENNNFSYTFISERIFSSQKNWYKRVMQVPMIFDGKYYFFFDEKNKDRIQKYNKLYKYMDHSQFMKKFYGSNIKNKSNSFLCYAMHMNAKSSKTD